MSSLFFISELPYPPFGKLGRVFGKASMSGNIEGASVLALGDEEGTMYPRRVAIFNT